MKRNFFYVLMLALSVVFCSCDKSYKDPVTGTKYAFPEGVAVVDQSQEELGEGLNYRCTFDGNGASGRVFASKPSIEIKKAMYAGIFEGIKDTAVFNDMEGWVLASVDSANYAKIYTNEEGEYRKNYICFEEDEIDFFEVIQGSSDFTTFDECIKDRHKSPFAILIIILLFAAGVALLVYRKKTGNMYVIFGIIPVDWFFIIMSILGLIGYLN